MVSATLAQFLNTFSPLRNGQQVAYTWKVAISSHNRPSSGKNETEPVAQTFIVQPLMQQPTKTRFPK
jgi:hypothetical protein